MTKIVFLKKVIAVALVGGLSVGVLASCKSETETSTISSESQVHSVPEAASAYLESVESQVKSGIEALTLDVLYENTQPWTDILAKQTTGAGVTYDGNAKCAFVQLSNVNEAVYQNVIFSFSVIRKDGAAAYASVIPLNVGSAKPTFILAYDESSEITDYSIEVVAQNSFESQTRTLDVPAVGKEKVVSSGMVYPGDMISIENVVYYYAGPERTMYEIGQEGVAEGKEGFSLKFGVSLVEADNLFLNNEQAEPLFTEDTIKLVDAQTKQELVWPAQDGYTITMETVETLQGTLMLSGMNLNTQSAFATMGWAKDASVAVASEASSEDSEADGRGEEMTDSFLNDAVNYISQVAFAYSGDSEPLYFMSSESYFTQ